MRSILQGRWIQQPGGEQRGQNDPLTRNLQVTPTFSMVGLAMLDVVPETQTVAFTLPVTQVTYGAVPIALSASARAGIPVTFTILSGSGAISGSMLQILAQGTIVVEASQGGSTTYAAGRRECRACG